MPEVVRSAWNDVREELRAHKRALSRCIAQLEGQVGGDSDVVLLGDAIKAVKPYFGQGANSALEDVTALYYNEESNEIYTGNNDGRVHIWSNLRSLPSAVRKPIADKKLVGDRPVRISLPSPL